MCRALEAVGMRTLSIGTGITSLDTILQRLRLGDNVVWQVDNLDDYQVFARAFANTISPK